MTTKATKTKTVKVIHEDDRLIRRTVRVARVPTSIKKSRVTSLVNQIVLPVSSSLEMTWGDFGVNG